MLESDPKQHKCRDGRYTFDPRNRNYQKAWWLAWRGSDQYNMVTLGDAIEAVLGMREAAVQGQHPLQDDPVAKSVCTVLSLFLPRGVPFHTVP